MSRVNIGTAGRDKKENNAESRPIRDWKLRGAVRREGSLRFPANPGDSLRTRSEGTLRGRGLLDEPVRPGEENLGPTATRLDFLADSVRGPITGVGTVGSVGEKLWLPLGTNKNEGLVVLASTRDRHLRRDNQCTLVDGEASNPRGPAPLPQRPETPGINTQEKRNAFTTKKLNFCRRPELVRVDPFVFTVGLTATTPRRQRYFTAHVTSLAAPCHIRPKETMPPLNGSAPFVFKK